MSTNGTTKGLYQKVAAITGELGKIAKDSKAPAEMGGFSFMSHGALMGHLRDRLAAHQVAIMESLDLITDEVVMLKAKDGERAHRRVVVKLTAEFINGENPDERYTTTWYGEALDTRDKAIQKAGTSAEKALLAKQFKVSDKDDPDGGTVDGEATRGNAAGGSENGHPDIPSSAEYAVLLELGRTLPKKSYDGDTIDKWLSKHGHEKVRASLLHQHRGQCGEDCEHVSAQPSLLPDTAEGVPA